MREIKTYSKGAPFYNAFLGRYPILDFQTNLRKCGNELSRKFLERF